jgi:hypothetical protein
MLHPSLGKGEGKAAKLDCKRAEVLPSLWATHFYALEADEIHVLHTLLLLAPSAYRNP